MDIKEFNRIAEDLDYNLYLKNKNEHHYFGVLLLLIPKDGEFHILLEKRATNVSQPNEICFPGGRYDTTDITIKETALRETYEEVGISPSKIKILGKLMDSFIPKGYIVSCYVGITSITIDDLKVNKDEVAKIFTIPLRYFIENEPTKYHLNIRVKATRKNPTTGTDEKIFPKEKTTLPLDNGAIMNENLTPVYMYDTQEGALWGLTAGFIKQFAAIVKNSMKI